MNKKNKFSRQDPKVQVDPRRRQWHGESRLAQDGRWEELGYLLALVNVCCPAGQTGPGRIWA